MRFVIVSILSFSWLFSPKPEDHCTSYLFSFARLDQADSEILFVHLPSAFATVLLSQTNMSIQGLGDQSWS